MRFSKGDVRWKKPSKIITGSKTKFEIGYFFEKKIKIPDRIIVEEKIIILFVIPNIS